MNTAASAHYRVVMKRNGRFTPTVATILKVNALCNVPERRGLPPAHIVLGDTPKGPQTHPEGTLVQKCLDDECPKIKAALDRGEAQ